MINRVDLKNDAKESLKDHWAESIKVLIILLIISIGTTILFKYILHFGIYDYEIGKIGDEKIVTTINYISPIIDSLLTFGFLSFFLKLSRNEEVTCNELFSKMHMIIKFIVMTILTMIIVTIGLFCLIIPGIMLAIGLSQTSLILLDNPNMNIIDAMILSWKMMNGYKMDYFMLIISFLGWIFILIFTLGIGYFWLIPYMNVTMCNFYNRLKEEYKEKAE